MHYSMGGYQDKRHQGCKGTVVLAEQQYDRVWKLGAWVEEKDRREAVEEIVIEEKEGVELEEHKGTPE